MSDEELLQEQEEEVSETPKDPAIAALERKNRELLKKVSAFQSKERERLKAQYPFITDEHLQGQNPEYVESLLRLATSQSTAPTEQPPAEPAEIEAAKDFVSHSGPATPTSTVKEVIPTQEALRRVKAGEWSESDFKANAELRLNR